MAEHRTEVPYGNPPIARVLLMDEVVQQIANGTIRVPRFQRPYLWSDEDRRLLFDSIQRGFPIGSMLLWQHEARQGLQRFGPFVVEAPARPDALWVVDGQQRLSTLALTFLAAEHVVGRAIYFDGVDREVVLGGARSPPRHHFPVSQAADPRRVAGWLREANVDVAVEEAVLDFSRRVQHARINAFIVQGDESEARRLFARVNNAGHPLKANEVFDALHGAMAGEEPSTTNALAQDLRSLGFGLVPASQVLRSLLAVEGHDPLHGERTLANDFDLGALTPALKRTDAALRSALQWLKHEARVPRVELLPYSAVLPALAAYFHKFPAPSGRNSSLLVRWLYRGALSGSHSSDAVVVRRSVATVRDAENEHAATQSLIRGTQPLSSTDLGILSEFRSSAARSRLEALALAALGPRHLETGAEIDVGVLYESEPRGLPRPVSRTHSSVLSNRIFHPRVKGNVFGVLRSARPEWRESHGFSGVLEERVDVALETRRTVLSRVVRDFLRRRAGIGADDGPGMDAFEDPDA